MRNIRALAILFIISMFLLNCKENVSAMNTGFSTENMADTEQQLFMSNVNVSLVTREPQKSPIKCFDVNDYGLIALGSEDSTGNMISVYTTDGKFKYGYTFDSSGSFAIEWDDSNLIIYFVRSDMAALVDESGAIIELQKIQNTMDNTSYWNNVIKATERVANGNQYIMKNDMGVLNILAPSYAQIIQIDTEGNTTTIYDASDTYAGKIVITLIAVILSIFLVVAILTKQIMKIRE